MLSDVTPVVLTLNEEANIERTLDKLRWARDVLLVDSGSTDATLAIAARFPNVRVMQRAFDSHAGQCNFALAEGGIRTPWVLFLDADYILTDAFVAEVSGLVPEAEISGYRARIVYCIDGRPLRATLYPPVTVLFRTERGRYVQDGHAHRVMVEGGIAELKAPIRHDDRKPLRMWLSSQQRYVALEAEKLLREPMAMLGWPDRVRKLRIVAPAIMPFYCLLWRGLALDGRPGLFYALQRTYAELMLSLCLLERDLGARSGGGVTEGRTPLAPQPLRLGPNEDRTVIRVRRAATPLTILVTGGAGYIGSHMVERLGLEGHTVVTIDNLSTGHRDAVRYGEFVQADLVDADAVDAVFSRRRFDLVMHFAASCYVGESAKDPDKYYRNNVVGTLNLLHAMRKQRVSRIVYSSSCAIYGMPLAELMGEDHPQHPISPYGRTKLAIEHVLADYGRAYRMQSVALRYFNAAGCDPEGELAERHEPETHLIPLTLAEAMRVAEGGAPAMTRLQVYGDDFPTPDGTCVRDYVHVGDLCEAHLLAAHRLAAGRVADAEAYNLGLGRGYSVKEVIAACRRVTGIDIRYRVVARRPGDPPRAVADLAKAMRVLGWRPQMPALDAIVATAWRSRLRFAGPLLRMVAVSQISNKSSSAVPGDARHRDE